MRCGLYGKLPAKRDFVAESVPAGFLALWEPWLQAGLAESRSDLGADWRSAWMVAPIWRFRLGSALCGRTVVGALMPSIDGVGRCFPLTLMSAVDAGRTPAPLTEEADESWFEAVEDLLLGALDDDRVWEDLLRDLDALPPPAEGVGETDLGADLSRATVWWTIGGADVAPTRVTLQGLPEPAFFARLLTGHLGP